MSSLACTAATCGPRYLTMIIIYKSIIREVDHRDRCANGNLGGANGRRVGTRYRGAESSG